MNDISFDSFELIKYLDHQKYDNQRTISNALRISLGKTNRLLTELSTSRYINTNNSLTEKSKLLVERNRPKRAIILAAGSGLRKIRINNNVSKAFLNVKGEILIERLIRQLHEINIMEIYIIVGFMKEEFEYLIDKYKVKLIVNNEYFTRNNLYSLFLEKNHIENCFIVPCDLYLKKNHLKMMNFNLGIWLQTRLANIATSS